MFKKLAEEKMLVVMRGLNLEHATSLCEALLEAKISFAEVSFSDKGAAEVLKGLKRSFGGKITLGGGTVYCERDYALARGAGADFVLSPGFSPEVARLSGADGLPYIPGVYTPTEVQAALGAGLSFLKLYPAEPLGLELLKAYKGPFPQASFMPFGGVTPANAHAYLSAGAVALGIGSYIANVPLLKAGRLAEISERIATFKQAIGLE